MYWLQCIFKRKLRTSFDFLKKELQFKEIKDEKLIIPEWLINGIAYSNNSIVIIFCDDFRDQKFSTIIYKIQSDFRIPYENEELFFTLEDLLLNKKMISESNLVANYKNSKELKNCIQNTTIYLRLYIDEIIYQLNLT